MSELMALRLIKELEEKVNRLESILYDMDIVPPLKKDATKGLGLTISLDEGLLNFPISGMGPPGWDGEDGEPGEIIIIKQPLDKSIFTYVMSVNTSDLNINNADILEITSTIDDLILDGIIASTNLKSLLVRNIGPYSIYLAYSTYSSNGSITSNRFVFDYAEIGVTETASGYVIHLLPGESLFLLYRTTNTYLRLGGNRWYTNYRERLFVGSRASIGVLVDHTVFADEQILNNTSPIYALLVNGPGLLYDEPFMGVGQITFDESVLPYFTVTGYDSIGTYHTYYPTNEIDFGSNLIVIDDLGGPPFPYHVSVQIALTSFSPYGVVVAGPTSTSPLVSITPGTVGYVFISGGPGVEPTWEPASSLFNFWDWSSTFIVSTNNLIADSTSGLGIISDPGSTGELTAAHLYLIPESLTQIGALTNTDQDIGGIKTFYNDSKWTLPTFDGLRAPSVTDFRGSNYVNIIGMTVLWPGGISDTAGDPSTPELGNWSLRGPDYAGDPGSAVTFMIEGTHSSPHDPTYSTNRNATYATVDIDAIGHYGAWATFTTLAGDSIVVCGGIVESVTAGTGPIAVSVGGTGSDSFPPNGVVISGSTSTSPLTALAPGVAGEVIVSTGTSSPPQWGVAGVAGGGTGSDFSTTGPGIVEQPTTGGNLIVVSVVPPVYGGTGTDLSTTTTPGVIVQPTAGGDLQSDQYLPLTYGGLGTDVSMYNGVPFISGGVTADMEYNLAGSGPPTVSDDNTLGYVTGSLWFY